MAIGTAKAREGSVLIFRKGDDDYHAVDSTGSTTSTTMESQLELVFTPSASSDYLIIGMASVGLNSTSKIGVVELFDVGTSTAYSSRTFKVAKNTDLIPYMAMFRLVGISTEQTIQMRMRITSSGTLSWQSLHLAAINLSDFPNYYYAEDRATDSTTSTSFVNKLTLTEATPVNNWHMIFYACSARIGPGAANVQTQTAAGDVTLDSTLVIPSQAGVDHHFPSTFFRHRPHASSNSWTIDFASGGGGQAVVFDAAICAIEINDEPSVLMKGNDPVLGNARIQ